MNRKEQLVKQLRGRVLPAMATPLDENGRLNEPIVPQLVHFLYEQGVGGLFVGGTTGEGILLTVAERMRLHASVMDAARARDQEATGAQDGRWPILIHVGAQRLEDTLRLTADGVALDVDGIVAITPWFYPLSDGALLSYFKRIADEAGETPFFVYDIPQFAVNGISPNLLGQLVNEIPTFAGIKSSRRDLQEIRLLIAKLEGSDALLLAGNEAILLGSLVMGAAGAISGLATAEPEPFVQLLAAIRAGDWVAGQEWQRKINGRLAQLPKGDRLGGIKKILRDRGIAVGERALGY